MEFVYPRLKAAADAFYEIRVARDHKEALSIAQRHEQALLEIYKWLEEPPSKRAKLDPHPLVAEAGGQCLMFGMANAFSPHSDAAQKALRGHMAAMEKINTLLWEAAPEQPQVEQAEQAEPEQPQAEQAEPPEQPQVEQAEPPEQPQVEQAEQAEPQQPQAEQAQPKQPEPPKQPPQPVPLDKIELNKPYWVVYYGGTKYKGTWRQVCFTQRPAEGQKHWHVRNSNCRGPLITYLTKNFGRVQVEKPENVDQRVPRA